MFKFKIFTKKYWRDIHDRRTKGFTRDDLWSLDYTFSSFIAPRLREFIKIGPEVAIPQSFLDAEYQKSLTKGYTWNTKWWRLDDKKENTRCFERAKKAWVNVLEHMVAGFEDEILEEQDWDAWRKKWTPVVKKYNKRLSKAKTIEEKQAIVDELRPGISIKSVTFYQVSEEDVVYHMRQLSKDLLARYYDSLWY